MTHWGANYRRERALRKQRIALGNTKPAGVCCECGRAYIHLGTGRPLIDQYPPLGQSTGAKCGGVIIPMDHDALPSQGRIGERQMPVFDRTQFAHPDDEAGIMMDGLGAALVTWCAMQNRSGVTVREAATAFNTTDAVIREAVEDAHWIDFHGPDDDPTKQVLELDGA